MMITTKEISCVLVANQVIVPVMIRIEVDHEVDEVMVETTHVVMAL